jgi:hypothetical protein
VVRLYFNFKVFVAWVTAIGVGRGFLEKVLVWSSGRTEAAACRALKLHLVSSIINWPEKVIFLTLLGVPGLYLLRLVMNCLYVVVGVFLSVSVAVLPTPGRIIRPIFQKSSAAGKKVLPLQKY